uniref:Polysaccharide biosynthesis protein n=1 Tax=Desulfobacca acetoxidans TaxID=60893 RepID=A0A7V6A201_9BACT
MPPTLTTDPQKEPAISADAAGSHRIFAKLASLLSARWFMEILQALFFIYLARISTSTYGEFMLAINLGTIIRLIAEFGLNVPLVGLLTQKERDAKEFLNQVLVLKAGLLTLAYIGAVAFINWQHYASPLYEFALIISLGFGLDALSTTFFTSLEVQGRQPQEGKIRAIAALMGYGYGFAAVFWGAPPLAIALFKPVETAINLLGGSLTVGLKGLWRRPTLAGLSSTLRRVLIFAVMEVTSILYNKANIFFLQKYAGSVGVAQYSATYQIIDGCSAIAATLILQSVLFPLFVKFWDVDRQEVILLARASARWLLGAGLLLMLVLWAEADRIIPLVYGPHFSDAVWLQRYLVITIFFALLHNLAGFLLISMRLERFLVMVYLVSLAFNLVFCWLVIPTNPLWGAALAIILTKGGMALVTFGFVQRRLKIFPLEDMVVVLLSSLLSLFTYWAGLFVLKRGWALLTAVLVLLGLLHYFWAKRNPLREKG